VVAESREMSHEEDRLWYGVMTVLATIYYSDSGAATNGVIRRPAWAHIRVLKAAQACSSLARATLLLSGIALAIGAMPSLCLRAIFFVSVAVIDLHYFTGYGGHPGFILLWFSAAMVLPPGPSRCGVQRVIVGHQLGSSGIHKLRIGGLAWLHPDTMAFILRFVLQNVPCKPHFFIEPTWLKSLRLIRVLLRSPFLLFLLGMGGAIIELSAPPIALLVSTPSVLYAFVIAGSLVRLAAPHCPLPAARSPASVMATPFFSRSSRMACSQLHVGVAPLLSILFPFNIPCYCLALIPPGAHDAGCVLTVPAMCAALVLGLSTLCSVEDWPVNAMVLFPYNAKQMAAISKLLGRFRLAHKDDSDVPPGPCLIESQFSLCPAIFKPELTPLLLGQRFDQAAEDDEMTLHALRQAVSKSRLFVDSRTYRCFDHLLHVPACSVGEKSQKNGKGE
jgi:hypothetical protein